MSRWSSQPYLKAGRKAGVPGDVLKNAVKTAKQVKQGCPPILTLNHLSHLTGVPHSFLHRMVSRTYRTEAYNVFKLRKPNVGHNADRFRWICAPSEELLRVQRWINTHILSKVEPHEASYAYDNRHGVLDAAELHCGAQWLIKLDLTNFFESILEPRVYELSGRSGTNRWWHSSLPGSAPVSEQAVTLIEGSATGSFLEACHIPQIPASATSPKAPRRLRGLPTW